MKSGFIWLLFIAGAFFSCKKKDGNIIIDGQGDGSGYGIVRADTFSLITGTIREDSLPANGLPYSLIGTMTDPLLGKTTANAFASATLLEPVADFPNTETPDSAVLYIPIIDGLNFYGDRLTPQSWAIYPLVTEIDAKTVYYQHAKPIVDLNLPSYYHGRIFSASYDSVRYKKGKLQIHPGLRIRLSADMAKKLMQMPKVAYQSDDDLKKYFSGIAIMPQDIDIPSGKGGVGVYDLSGTDELGARANIMLYYRDTQTFVFTFAGASRTITTGKTGPWPAAVQTQLNNDSVSFPVTYVQSLGGLKTYIQLPTLLNVVQNQNVAINKAQITFYIDKTSVSADFPAPLRLNLFRPYNGGSRRNFLLADGTSANFGGIFDQQAGTYTFNITRHVQDLMNAKAQQQRDIDYGLYLTVPTAEPVLATRVAIDQTKTKLVITYTKLN